ncbi:alanine racemase [Actinoplanes sp. NPDC049265]|uniref:alanine racemase n=1 Tax=Actinoplanes sp. NPDC049265 TaxID=3363902 RepID=UPI00372312F1
MAESTATAAMVDPAAERTARTTVTVDLDIIAANARAARALVAPAEVMAVVKADAYGHGAAEVARAVSAAGVPAVAVAFVEEGLRLRESLPDREIVVLTEPLPGEEAEAIRARLTLTVYTWDGVGRVGRAATGAARPAAVHLKIDTGMHRLGVAPEDTAEAVARIDAAGLRLEAIWTHLATADDPSDDFAAVQLRRLHTARGSLAEKVRSDVRVHAANSAAALRLPSARFDAVRVGALLYGIRPGAALPVGDRFRPAMRWTTTVVQTRLLGQDERLSYGLTYRLDRPSTVAVIPVGFADGLPRLLSNRGQVLIRGRRFPIAGAVGMSHAVIDCGDTDVRPGEQVTLLGSDNAEEVSAEELASRCGRTVYELVTGIAPGIPRRYRRASSQPPGSPPGDCL